MSKHTPGPWQWHRKTKWGYDSLSPAVIHGTVEGLIDVDENDARLIAAAPDLLAVLQDLEASAPYWSEYDVPIGIVDRIRAAIAKATGEQP